MSSPKPSFNSKRKNSGNIEQRYPSVLLWGHTQVGKTSLFASAFCGEEGAKLAQHFPDYDREKNFENLSRLDTLFRTLKSGQKLPATTGDEKTHDFRLDFAKRKRIVFQDIKGGLVDQITTNENIKRELREAEILLCMIQWNANYLVRELNSVKALFPYFEEKMALVFTKAEKGLAHDDEAWKAQKGWWKTIPWLEKHHETMERFEHRVWPVSCYGYQDDGTPSLTLGEFGQIMPYNIKPHKVLEPIKWAIETLLYSNDE